MTASLGTGTVDPWQPLTTKPSASLLHLPRQLGSTGQSHKGQEKQDFHRGALQKCVCPPVVMPVQAIECEGEWLSVASCCVSPSVAAAAAVMWPGHSASSDSKGPDIHTVASLFCVVLNKDDVGMGLRMPGAWVRWSFVSFFPVAYGLVNG